MLRCHRRSRHRVVFVMQPNVELCMEANYTNQSVTRVARAAHRSVRNVTEVQHPSRRTESLCSSYRLCIVFRAMDSKGAHEALLRV